MTSRDIIERLAPDRRCFSNQALIVQISATPSSRRRKFERLLQYLHRIAEIRVLSIHCRGSRPTVWRNGDWSKRVLGASIMQGSMRRCATSSTTVLPMTRQNYRRDDRLCMGQQPMCACRSYGSSKNIRELPGDRDVGETVCRARRSLYSAGCAGTRKRFALIDGNEEQPQ